MGGTVTVTCTITEIKLPSLPTTTTYLIGSGPLVINMTPNFTQYPPCDYTLSEFILWDFSPSPAPVVPNASNKYQITIDSNDISKAREQTLTLRNSITYGTQSFSPSVSFKIDFLHPCRRTSFNAITIQTINYKLRNGQNLDTQTPIPTDVASTTYGDGLNTCGARSYEITDSTGKTPSWVTAVSTGADAGKFIIRVSIDDESYIAKSPHNMLIKVGFANYPASADALHPTRTFPFTVNVQAATCDCSLITWNDPKNIPVIINASVVTKPTSQVLLEAGPEQSSLTATSGARACNHAKDECDYKYTIVAYMKDKSPLPSWITYKQPTLTVTPTLSEHMGDRFVSLEQVRISNGVKTVYTAAWIKVACEILTWTPPTMPTIAQATYTVFDPDFTITMKPAFTQQPPCAYKADMTFKWSLPSGSPIYQTSDPYSVLVSSKFTKTEGIYTVFLDNTIQYGTQVWNERVSYDITVVNPCLKTELFTKNTTLSDISYAINDTAVTKSFVAVSDTVTNAITTGGSCGKFVYTLTNNDTRVGTPFLEVVDLLNAKGIRIYTENSQYVGNFTVTLTVRMEEYPTKTAQFDFNLTITKPKAAVPVAVSFAPQLRNDIKSTVKLEPGDSWSITLDPYDVDGDLAEVYLTYSDSAKNWIEFDRKALTIRTTSSMDLQTLGTFVITVQLEDLTGKISNYPIVLEVVCSPGSRSKSKLCAPPSNSTSESTAKVPPGIEVASTKTPLVVDQFLDYEVKKVKSISQ